MAERRGPVRLGAALFNADHAHLADEVRRVEQAGLDFIHLDVFDGHFVPDLGFPPRTIAALRPLTSLPFEVHLGAVDPLRFLPHLADAGVDQVLVHLESVPLLYESLHAMREHGLRAGLALTLGTSLTNLEPAIPMIDAVLLLARVTGEGARGAHFNPLVLPRVVKTRRLVEEASIDVDVQVAGGVTRDHISLLAGAGATAIGLGSGIYRAPDMTREVAEMRALALQEV